MPRRDPPHPPLPRRIVSVVRRNVPLAAIDLAIVVAAYALALAVRFEGEVPATYRTAFRTALPLLALSQLGWNYLLGLYGEMWRHASVQEARRVLAAGALGLASALAIALIPVGGGRALPLSVAAMGALLTMLGIGGVRFQSRLFAFRRSMVVPRTPVAVMGVGPSGDSLLRDIFRNPSLGLAPVALIDDDPRQRGRTLHGVRVIGGRGAIEAAVARYGAEQLLLAIPSADGELLRDVAERCELVRIPMRILPPLGEIVTGRATVRDLRDVRIEDLLGRQQVGLDPERVRLAIRGKRVLITGAGGSIGSEIARQVEAFEPESLSLLDHDETHLFDVRATLERDAGTVLADVRDRARVTEVMREIRPQVIFHAAAHKHVPILEEHPQEAFATNVLGTANLVDAALTAGVERFVLISTDKAVKPVSVMGASKRLAEEVVRSHLGRGPVFAVVRFGNVLGSRGSVVPTFVRQIRAGGPVTITHPEMTRYFMSVHEAVQLVLEAGATANDGEVMTLEMGEPVRVIDLARRMIRLAGQVPGKDVEIVISGPRPGEKLHEELVDPGEHVVPSDLEGISVSRPPMFDAVELRRLLFALDRLSVERGNEELGELMLRAVAPETVIEAVGA